MMNTSQVSPARQSLPLFVTSTVTPSTAMQNQGIATNQNSIGGAPLTSRAITGVEQLKHKKKQKDMIIDGNDEYGSENVKQMLNNKVVVVRKSKRLQQKENIDNNQAWKKKDKKVVKSSRSSKKTKSSTNTATKKIKKVKGSDVKVSAKPVRRSRRLAGLAVAEDDVVVNNVQDVVAISTRVEEVVDKRESTTNINQVIVKVQEVVDEEVEEVQPPIEDITSSNDENVVEMVTPVVDDTGMNVQKEVEDWYSTRYGILDATIKQHNDEKDDDDTLPVKEEQSNTVVVETVDVHPPVQVTSTKRARLEYVLSSESSYVEPCNQQKRRKIEKNAETESADVQPPVHANNTSATSSRPPKRIRPEYVLSSETTDEEPKKKRHKIVQPPVQTTSTNNTSVELNKSAAVEDDVLPPDQTDNVESDAPKKKKITVLYSPELGFYYLLPLEEGGDYQVQLVHYDAHGVFPFFVSPRPKGDQPPIFVAAQGQRTDDWDECADIPENLHAAEGDDTDKDREKKIIKRRLYARAKKSRINELADNLALSIIRRYNLKKLPTAELEWLYLLCYSRHWKSRDGPTAAYLEVFHDACVAWEKGQGKVFKF